MAALHRGKASDKIGRMKLNGIILNSMPNGRGKQAYVQVFDCKNITKQFLDMFWHMEIAEFIYECAVEPSYKNYYSIC